jgi:D-alanyl-D-alanine dipeptidase
MKYLALSLLLSLLQCAGKQPKSPAPTPDTATVVVPQPKPAEPEPPTPPGIDYDTTQPAPVGWAEITRLDPTIRLDLRYATDNNFVKEKMYDCPRCFLRPDVAKALVKAHKQLKKRGLGLKMYDCYRPRPIQWKLWNKVPDERYVADPRKGSMHNRGMAADLTIVDSEGRELDMGTDFDFFGKEAYHEFTGHPKQVLDNRQLLLETMEEHNFRPTTTEWWHYSYKPKTFPIDDWVWKCE